MVKEMFWKGPSVVVWKVKGKERRNTFSLARFFYFNFTIGLVLLVMLLIWTILQGLQSPSRDKDFGNTLEVR